MEPLTKPPEIILTDEQNKAVDSISTWFKNSPDLEFRLGGYAGTGKTTIIKSIVKSIGATHRVVVCAFTGKAVNVLNKKGVSSQTIHSLIYHTEIINKVLTFTLKDKHDVRAIDSHLSI